MKYIGLYENRLDVKKEILAGDNLLNFLRLLVQNRFRVSIPYLPRLFYSLAMGFIGGPFRLIEHWRFYKKIESTDIRHPPLFLLGHWRSGTTYLHNIISQDRQFGFVSTYHAFLPGCFLAGESIFKPIVNSSLPKKRPMDDVAMDVDLPQEEEYAIGGLSPYSYYHGWCFPKNMEFYNRFVCFDGVSKDMIEEWKRIYIFLLKKETFIWHGRRLLLKNPANTGRVKLLLDMFPDAKFVHIYRNPYDLYFSMIRFMKTVIPLYCLQTPPPFEDVEEIMMKLYVDIYHKYLIEKRLIPTGNLVEIKYEDFITDPIRGVKRIYEDLNLDGFTQNEMVFRDFVLSQRDIKTHSYDLTDEVRSKVSSRWGFVFKEFGYEL